MYIPGPIAQYLNKHYREYLFPFIKETVPEKNITTNFCEYMTQNTVVICQAIATVVASVILILGAGLLAASVWAVGFNLDTLMDKLREGSEWYSPFAMLGAVIILTVSLVLSGCGILYLGIKVFKRENKTGFVINHINRIRHNMCPLVMDPNATDIRILFMDPEYPPKAFLHKLPKNSEIQWIRSEEEARTAIATYTTKYDVLSISPKAGLEKEWPWFMFIAAHRLPPSIIIHNGSRKHKKALLNYWETLKE